MQEIFNSFNKDLEEIKHKQTAMNNKINEIKNTLEGVLKKYAQRKSHEFYLGKNYDQSPGDSTDNSEKLAQRGNWGISIYVILVKKEFMQSGTYFTKGFLLFMRS